MSDRIRRLAQRMLLASSTFDVKDLPRGIKAGLKAVGYRQRTIDVISSTSINTKINRGWDDGSKEILQIFTLNSGVLVYMKDVPSPTTPIDKDYAYFRGANISGRISGTLYVHPSVYKTLGSIQVEGIPSLSEKEILALRTVYTMNTRGRRDEFEYYDLGPYAKDNPLLQSLHAKGLIEIKGSGIVATSKGQSILRMSPFVRSLMEMSGESSKAKMEFLRDYFYEKKRKPDQGEMDEIERAWRHDRDLDLILDYVKGNS